MDIFLQSIKLFDEETKGKLYSPSQYRLLIIDGHSSHESLATMEYCLPSHTTHALQPLDIVLFSPLKQAWAKVVASEEFDGRKVTKVNFLEIYGIAHLQSFTLGNILASFRKSGIWPLDPTIITAEMMALSTVESMDIDAITHIDLPSPVK